MGVDLPVGPAGPEATAEALLSAFTTIGASERRRHATVFNYWLSIRGDLHFPLIQDLDPLEISDAGPHSVLLELIGAGEDAEIRHIGQALAVGAEVERISAAPGDSLLGCIAARLPEVASTRRALSFEQEFETADATTRCWITLLPFSSTGTWVDYVYGFASSEVVPKEADAPEAAEADVAAAEAEVEQPYEATEPVEPVIGEEAVVEIVKTESVPAEPEIEAAAVPAEEARSAGKAQGGLPSKLDEARARAEEARMAKLRAEAALCEAVSAAYDFALDAEGEAEDYLRLVERQGLKIQLRSPMTPVAKLVFAGSCEEEAIPRIEAILAWALKADLPRGSLGERIEAEGGLGPILAGEKPLQ